MKIKEALAIAIILGPVMVSVLAIANAYFYYTMIHYNNGVTEQHSVPTAIASAPTTDFVNDTVKPSNITTVVENVSVEDNSLIVKFNYTTAEQGLEIDYFQCTIDNSLWGECSSPFEMSLEGYDNSHMAHNHTLEIRAVDMNGNIEPMPAVVFFPLKETETVK